MQSLLNPMHATLGLVIFIATLHTGCNEPQSTTQSTDSESGDGRIAVNEWPQLPTNGFVKGRVATEEDVSNGNAIFAAFGTVTSDAMKVAIPQYAILSSDDGETRRVIVVQAEIVHGESGDVETFGLRPVEGGDPIVDVSDNVTLLGVDY